MESISFEERARIGMEMLAKQKPVTLEEMREQVNRVKIQSSNPFMEEGVKTNLRAYYPDWDEEQVDSEFKRLKRKYALNQTKNKK